MKKLYRNFINTYFNKELDFRARLFTVLALSGVLISVLTCLQSLFTSMWMTAVTSAMMAAASVFIMHYARRSGNYRRCYSITIVVIFLLFFPFLFFTSGGYHSGMPSIFIFAVIFTMMMLDGRRAFIMAGIELVLYSVVCWICYLYPELVTAYPTEQAVLTDILFAYSTVSVACGTAVFLHLREYNRQRHALKEKNKQLQQMDEAKSTFLTTVAHEVKNPLNIISLHAQDTAELLSEEPIDLAQIRENQKIIGDTVIRINRVLTDLMDTVSIEQGRLNIVSEPVLLADIIREAVKPWQKQYASGKIRTRVVLALNGSLPMIRADRGRIDQVMSNLLSNAFLHTKSGTVTVELSGNTDEQIVCVADNGEGMDEELRKKALEGYVSADKDYWRHGIGLYVCHRVVQAHGGTIEIKSKKGKGTRVTFTLPYEEKKQ